MKSLVPIATLLIASTLAGCAEKEGTGEGPTTEKVSPKVAPKLILGPQSPTPPIEPSPVPSLPANVKEGMERKDPEPGPDMPSKPPETKPPIEATVPKSADAPK